MHHVESDKVHHNPIYTVNSVTQSNSSYNSIRPPQQLVKILIIQINTRTTRTNPLTRAGRKGCDWKENHHNNCQSYQQMPKKRWVTKEQLLSTWLLERGQDPPSEGFAAPLASPQVLPTPIAFFLLPLLLIFLPRLPPLDLTSIHLYRPSLLSFSHLLCVSSSL